LVWLFQVTLSPEFTPSGCPTFAPKTSGVNVIVPSGFWLIVIFHELAMANNLFLSDNI
jgi:hypothetical protein